jgi:hypothetical protein
VGIHVLFGAVEISDASLGVSMLLWQLDGEFEVEEEKGDLFQKIMII